MKDDDLLTPEEFTDWLKSIGVTHGKGDIESIFMVLDSDGSDRIRCGEFVTTITMQFDDKSYDFDQKAAAS